MAYTTPCIRCGKMRIVTKSWNEDTGISLITHTQTVCPDPVCQEIVETELQVRKGKLEALQRKSLERMKTIKRVKKGGSFT